MSLMIGPVKEGDFNVPWVSAIFIGMTIFRMLLVKEISKD